ncbi:MAG: hypothetical protein NTY38_21835 [Acidobacteria bacterium]|nr:hypothetical protein [Acidobacteriota bacterium]
MTAQNSEREPMAPSAVAPSDPFIDVLIGDIAESLPPELAAIMESTTSPGEVTDWIAAGAMYRWIEEPNLRGTFVNELKRDPKRAGLALAKAVAAKMEPPPREEAWRRADRMGLALQLTLVTVVIGCRGIAISLLSYFASGFESPVSWLALMFASLLDYPLLFADAGRGLLLPAVLLCAAVWHAIEAKSVPHWMEHARQWPSRRKGLMPPLSWRLDTFQRAWFLQSAALWLAASAAASRAIIQTVLTDPSVWTMAGAILIFLGLVSSLRCVAVLASRLWRY